jgi:endonuclease YncB( thermonuclease family)
MRKIFTILLVLLTPFIAVAAKKKSESFSAPATVGYIFDGDTFAAIVRLENGTGVSVRVRILGIDAPEIHGMCESEISAAHRARTRLRELLPEGAAIKLSKIKDDKYLGRIDAYVENSDGLDVGKTLLREKLVRPYGGGKRAGWCD